MTLLPEQVSLHHSRKSFSLTLKRASSAYAVKVDAYRRSAYALTRQIAETAPEAWTPELLDLRQR
ncbi:MAG: hypothetical protein RML57_12940 [Acidobacteriota bacterium]|nr:hypothetical protein [Acidobacteriota bacterium]